MGSKALALIAGWVFHQGFMASHGGKPVDFIAKLATAHSKVPLGLAGLIAIAAFVPAFLVETGTGPILGEVGTLLLASATFSHIFGYEHGGKFNPIFPLMFLGPSIVGMLNIYGSMLLFNKLGAMAAVGLLGNGIVGFGGMMAMYVMYVSMKQAKVQGDLKRDALRQHRKEQREAQRAARAAVEDKSGAGSSKGS